MRAGVHLERRDLDPLTHDGEQVGVAGVLAHLDRRAERTRVPGRAVAWGFTWNEQDRSSRAWFPQGISTSADAGRDDELLVTTWYSKAEEGSRLSFVDLGSLTYRHVLVVRAGERGPEPLSIHAGGVVWHGPWLHLAATRRGLFTAHVDDLVEVSPGPATFGYRFLLPVRHAYAARAEASTEPLRYSFLSLDHEVGELVVGEYGVQSQTTRLARYALDPASHGLRLDESGRAYPLRLDDGRLGHMQGATVAHGRHHVTVSRGRKRLGRLYVGEPGRLRPVRWALPPGPEDIAYWPATDQLWSLSEHPGSRYVFAMDRTQLRRRLPLLLSPWA
ncbi:hypothetical protein D9V37_02360 [Nocardioides mangrovicus]|uniref:Uncharacterized protein n=1 Tax=Nocardioides mangrovicus TaxID=2478913 RepID=A0A3L8P5Y6_9ACTN|nr:hypothetical protein [Nocardioides mangrovicus]RLV50820.1 hypothetical protein D9V37_02360 [Nocardioides mangrovicus]